jgi:hypothetical protein
MDKKVIITITIFLLLSGIVLSQERFKAGILLGNYHISDNRYGNIYGKSNFIYGGFVTFEIINKFEIIGSYRTFSKNGKENYPDASFKLSPISFGIRYLIIPREYEPYSGMGISSAKYQDKTPYYEVSETKTAYYVEGGIYISQIKHLIFDLNFKYIALKVQPFDTEINLGGFEFGFGAGIRF